MPRARRKAPRQEAPQSIQDATVLTARYISLLNRIDQSKLTTQKARDHLDAELDKKIKPMEDEAKAIFRQLRPWWAANKDDLTEGKRKSIELAGAQIGERTTTPALAVPKGMTLGSFVEWLIGRGLKSLVRNKPSVDKPACIRALRSLDREEPSAGAPDAEFMEFSILRGMGQQLADKGAAITQKDEFFIDRAPPKDGETSQQIEVESEGEAA